MQTTIILARGRVWKSGLEPQYSIVFKIGFLDALYPVQCRITAGLILSTAFSPLATFAEKWRPEICFWTPLLHFRYLCLDGNSEVCWAPPQVHGNPCNVLKRDLGNGAGAGEYSQNGVTILSVTKFWHDSDSSSCKLMCRVYLFILYIEIWDVFF